MTELDRYAMAYVVSPDGKQVVLLNKRRPHYLAGKWMGVAGHVEPHESPVQAVQREFLEEAGVDIADWSFVKVLEKPERPSDIYVYFSVHDLADVRTMTDEEVRVFTLDELATLDKGNALIEIEEQLRIYMTELQRLTMPSVPATSDPVNGWVVVQAISQERADGFALLPEEVGVGTEPWYFSVVNIDGRNEAVTTAKLGEVVEQFALQVTKAKAIRGIYFGDALCERLYLARTYTPEVSA